MNQIKAVIFDLGRVLVQVDFSRGLLRHFAAESGDSELKILDQAFRDPLFKKFSKGLLNERQFYNGLMKRFQQPVSYKDFEQLWCDIFSPLPGMDELVGHVALRYPVGFLSDIDPLHWKFLRKNYSLLNYFQNPVLSFEIGALKPSPKCYKTASTAVGHPPQFCLFIDDRPINIIGAKKMGMHTIHFKNPTDLQIRLEKLKLIA